MRDFKHISGKKRSIRLRILSRRHSTSLNSFKTLVEPKLSQNRLRYLLPLLAVILAAYPVGSLLLSARNASSSVNSPPKKAIAAVKPYGDLNDWQSFSLATESLPASRYEGEYLVAPLPDGGKLVYTVDQELQSRVTKVLESYKVPYGAFVAIEPKTGRILALAGYSAVDPTWVQRSCYNLYPMASLFKIVTAAAALEQKKVSPTTVLPFGGRLTSENPKYWDAAPVRRGRQQQMDLTMAMGKSVNPVFGRLASDVVGRESLMAAAVLFGFNQSLFPETPVTPSKAQEPQNNQELRLMGAGLCKEVKISPLHAAALMAAIANNGTLMQPALAAQITNGKGEQIYSPKNHALRRFVSQESASQLTQMLSTTVNTGTSRKAFHDRRGRPKLASIDIAAKTGSINGTDPAGHYSWFAAYAPANDPQIALAALVVNNGKWRIKASHVGEQALEAFFK